MMTSDQNLWLAIDAGTTAIKAGVFTDDGERVSIASRENVTLSPKSGWAEQDMDRIWELCVEATKESLSGVDPNWISAIGITGQGDGLWVLDETFKPMRNAILWNDQRATELVQEWEHQGLIGAIAKRCGTAVWPGSTGPLLGWLKKQEPDNYNRIGHVCWCKDWLGFKLTGTLANDYTDATIPFFDLNSGKYDPHLFEECSLTEIDGKLATPQHSHKVLGQTHPDVMTALGLEKPILVTIGALDVAAMHVGAGINEIGESLIILGTTAVVSTVVASQALDGDPVGATVMHPKADRWLNVQAPQSGASALDWLANQHIEKWPGGAVDIVQAASNLPDGASGIIFLPFLTGERAPFVAPMATGAFFGLTSTTKPEHTARAVLEGVAYSLRHCIDMSGAGVSNNVLVTGGGANSSLWMQILADILSTEIRTSSESELGLLGAARLAASVLSGSDPYGSVKLTAGHGAFKPNPNKHATYDEAYRRYRSLVDQMMPIWN